MHVRKLLLPSLILALVVSVSMPPAFAAITPCDGAPSAAKRAAIGKINLNTADQATLQRELSGIGSTKAAAIVEHRDTYGAFVSVDELLEVQGIGKSLMDRNRHRLAVD